MNFDSIFLVVTIGVLVCGYGITYPLWRIASGRRSRMYAPVLRDEYGFVERRVGSGVEYRGHISGAQVFFEMQPRTQRGASRVAYAGDTMRIHVSIATHTRAVIHTQKNIVSLMDMNYAAHALQSVALPEVVESRLVGQAIDPEWCAQWSARITHIEYLFPASALMSSVQVLPEVVVITVRIALAKVSREVLRGYVKAIEEMVVAAQEVTARVTDTMTRNEQRFVLNYQKNKWIIRLIAYSALLLLIVFIYASIRIIFFIEGMDF